MRTRLDGLREKVLNELHKSFHEDKEPEEIALSFSIGIFITSLPTLGTGLILFVLLDRFFDFISRLALVASLVVINPLIKPLFYLASINLGGLILTRQLSITTNPETVLMFLLVGNFVIAIVLSIIGYFFALEAVKKYREEELSIVEQVEEVIPQE